MVGNDRSTRAGSNCSVVTIGSYDGVHLGHRRLIEITKEIAGQRGCKSIVVTFGVHPSAVLRPGHPVPLLCTLDEKIELLRETGVDEVVVLDFDDARLHERAEDFIIHDVIEPLGAVAIVVGSNFRFGFQRRGDVAMLERLGAQYGFSAQGIDLVLDDEFRSVVSSSRIRALIGDGKMLDAATRLGQPYRLPGTVSPSFELTVAPELLVPPSGTYRVEVVYQDGKTADPEQRGLGLVEIGEHRSIRVKVLEPSITIDRAYPIRVEFGNDRERGDDVGL